MKILLIPEFGETGGTAQFLRSLVKSIDENWPKAELTVILGDSQTSYPFTSELRRRTRVDLRFILEKRPFWGKIPYFSLIWEWRQIARTVQAVSPDVIVVSSGTPRWMYGSFLAEAPVLYFLHTYPFKAFRPQLGWFVRKVLRAKKNLFVTVSDFSRTRTADALGLSSDLIKVVYNSYSPPVETHARERKFGSSRLVLTIGHFVHYKNPDTWLRVAEKVVKELPDVKFLWMGDGEDVVRYRDMIEGKKLSDRISIESNSEKKEQLLRECALYFQPSLIESHGIAVIDAMVRSIPCVTSDSGGLPESVVNGETGLTCGAKDVNGFAVAIRTILNEPDFAQRLVANGKARAEALFNPEKQRRLLKEAIESVVLPGK